ncbi:hypothetical protein J2Q11_13685 [Tenacibaculum finnmarkense genomovar finnmarkense]|nr:hypothetical protein [Tenacibaculum finnmarkense]MCD8440939.1 hypothetical protein [Tenacibaculum finnmarkense genomovar ulcerans]MCD8418732.1 hypothetical protein [Tenacibaculum finnmarkense genomovar finnmarkense]MCG8187042.1 hypothetical protein [Tenacibaculum finnmarkense genomovar finnmarkense]MCG8203551.1 hypothetical protein [Tenacibaculum finnmarkense genomovar finnmarkense]MCG8211074.1 hypothetical protein [Tenacibaculum finnmarkense genomovar finnmarkense]
MSFKIQNIMSLKNSEQLANHYGESKIPSIISSAHALNIIRIITEPSKCHMDKLPMIKEGLRLMDSDEFK